MGPCPPQAQGHFVKDLEQVFKGGRLSSHWGSALTSAGTPGPRGLELSPGFLICLPGGLVLLAHSLGWMDVYKPPNPCGPGRPLPLGSMSAWG